MAELRTVIAATDELSAPADSDVLVGMDVSDTTGTGGGAEGTPKRGLLSVLKTYFSAHGSNSITGTGTANRIGTATTANALHDTMLAASAATQVALAVQAAPSQTASPFVVEGSNGTNWFEVQSDGGVIIDQRTGATYANILNVKYQGNQRFYVDSTGIAYASLGFNGGGGFFTTDANGNVVALGNITGRHLIGNGTSPTVTGNGSSNGSVSGKDMAGKITVGTGTTTSIVLTFGAAYATAPALVVNAQTTTTPIKVVTTTTTATLTTTAFTAGEVLCYVTAGF